MTPRFVGERIPRLEDVRFLTGTARYVADIEVPRLLHAAIVRSPLAHGHLRGLDRTGLDTPVALCLGPEEIRERAGTVRTVWVLPSQRQVERALIQDRVRFVGEPVGIIVAHTASGAADAGEQVHPTIEELPAVATAAAALAPGAPLLYPEWGSNVAIDVESGDTDEHTKAVFDSAPHVFRTTMKTGRLTGAPMECRGIVAIPDAGTGRFTVWTSTQAPHMVKDMLATVLRIPHHRLRVIAPDVGGGFGLKDHLYEDEALVCMAALELGRPVRWIEGRRDSLTVTTQARDETWEVEVAFTDDGTLLGLRVHGIRDTGAYLSIFGGGPLATMMSYLPGPYGWQAVRATGQVVVTNRAPSGAYRGFGQPQAVYVRERAVDMIARELRMDPVELRLRNMIAPDELPYSTRTLLTYETGDYPMALRRAAELIDSGPVPVGDGRARGIGFSCYVEGTGVGPTHGSEAVGVKMGSYETASVQMDNDGSVRLYVGTSSHGQGHETTFAQLAADELGVPIESVSLARSDTDSTPYSPYGTAASRSIALGGGAVVRAARALAQKLRRIAGEILEASPEDIVLENGKATLVGTDSSAMLAEVARAGLRGFPIPDGLEPGLEETFVHDPENLSFSYATQACRVAVDRETGLIEVERFVVVHDCGTIVNPTIVEGQIHGGFAQGLGAALLEEVAYNEDGQPLTTTFMDYLVPTSDTTPNIDIEHHVHPSPFIPGGMKGMGEGGTIGAPAAVVNAIADALPDVAYRLTATPVTPWRLWSLMRQQTSGAL